MSIKINIRQKPVYSGFSYLSDFQKDIISECLLKGSGGLSLPMGTGKTLISICLALTQTDDLILIIVSKSLISNWIEEINKFFHGTHVNTAMQYEIFHPDFIKKDINVWKPHPFTKLILTTPEIISKYYGELEIERRFIFEDDSIPPYVINRYNVPNDPYLKHEFGGGLFHSVRWGCLIVDEIQNYNNIKSLRCQGLASLCATHRWGLSGTVFTEPKIERILGYFLILNLRDQPRCLPEVGVLVKSEEFTGLNETLVIRENNIMFIPPELKEVVLSHTLSQEEAIIYTLLKDSLLDVKKQIKTFQRQNNIEEARRFTTYILAMITYLRECLVCPIIPLATIAINMADFRERSQLSVILTNKLNEMGLTRYLNDVNSVVLLG